MCTGHPTAQRSCLFQVEHLPRSKELSPSVEPQPSWVAVPPPRVASPNVLSPSIEPRPSWVAPGSEVSSPPKPKPLTMGPVEEKLLVLYGSVLIRVLVLRPVLGWNLTISALASIEVRQDVLGIVVGIGKNGVHDGTTYIGIDDPLCYWSVVFHRAPCHQTHPVCRSACVGSCTDDRADAAFYP